MTDSRVVAGALFVAGWIVGLLTLGIIARIGWEVLKFGWNLL